MNIYLFTFYGTDMWVSAFTAYCFSSAFAFNEAMLAQLKE